MPRPMTARARELIDHIPPIVRKDQLWEALFHPLDLELSRVEAFTEWLHAQTSPATATKAGAPNGGEVGGLRLWEILCGLPHDESMTEGEMRERLLTHIRGLNTDGSANELRAQTERIAPGTVIEQHDPADPTTPPPNTLRFIVPEGPDAERFADLRRRFDAIIPAHVALEVDSADGFALDLSQTDLEGLG